MSLQRAHIMEKNRCWLAAEDQGQFSLRGVTSAVFSVKTTISVSCDMGTRSKIDDIVNLMMQLQARECVNINFVTPTHVIPHIIESVF